MFWTMLGNEFSYPVEKFDFALCAAETVMETDYAPSYVSAILGKVHNQPVFLQKVIKVNKTTSLYDLFNFHKYLRFITQVNPGEEVGRFAVYMDNYEIPATRTTYVDMVFNVPQELCVDGKLAMFRADADRTWGDSSKYLHHFVVSQCGTAWKDIGAGGTFFVF